MVKQEKKEYTKSEMELIKKYESNRKKTSFKDKKEMWYFHPVIAQQERLNYTIFYDKKLNFPILQKRHMVIFINLLDFCAPKFTWSGL